MHTVQRAIIMAAGLGKRMQPITDTTPKPLVTVNGTRMIDTVIHALHHNGISEIYVVVGHLKEQFYPLEQQYPGLKIIENPYFDTCNNISSLYVARDHIEDVMILDGDQMIYNPEILQPSFEKSGYNCVWTDSQTEEWLLTLKHDTITSCSRNGGAHGWQLYSVSRWTKADGQKLRAHLEYEFETRQNRQIYWDDIALFCYPEAYKLGIQAMHPEDIIEIDNLTELAAIDPIYQHYLNGGTPNEHTEN